MLPCLYSSRLHKKSELYEELWLRQPIQAPQCQLSPNWTARDGDEQYSKASVPSVLPFALLSSITLMATLFSVKSTASLCGACNSYARLKLATNGNSQLICNVFHRYFHIHLLFVYSFCYPKYMLCPYKKQQHLMIIIT